MLGIRFIKSQPTTYLMQFRGGKVVRELSPTTRGFNPHLATTGRSRRGLPGPRPDVLPVVRVDRGGVLSR